MAKTMLIDATHPEETRVVVADGTKVEEFDFESLNKRQLAGNIYLAKVTRVEPSLQAAFVDYGGNRHGFLAFSEIHPDYYQIPVADREALLREEREYAEAMAEEAEAEEAKPKRGRRPRRRKTTDSKPEATNGDAVTTGTASAPSGMDVVDLGEDEAAADDMTATDVAGDGGGWDDDLRDRAAEDAADDADDADEAEATRWPKPSPMTTPKKTSARCASRVRGNTRSRKWSRSARSCWCRSSRKSAATRARR